MSRAPSRADIVRSLVESGRPLHAREIAARCGVAEGSYSKLLGVIEQLSRDRKIAKVKGGRYEVVSEAGSDSAWDGVLSLNPRGFGFVNAAGREDVYIPPEGVGAAMHGDRVRVSVIERTQRGAAGRIESIVARRNPRVAGVLRRRGKSAWLEPDDTRVRGPIVLTGGVREGKE